MSDRGTPKRSFGRRALTGVAVLAIAATGAAWSGCGDDNDDEVSNAIEEANSTASSISEEAQQQAEEAQQQAEDAAADAQDQAQEAQEDAQDAIDEATEGTTTTP